MDIKRNYSTSAAVIASPDIHSESVYTLKQAGIDTLFSCKNKNVNPFLSYHADMQIVKIGEKKFVCAPECFDYYNKLLKKYDIKLIAGNTYLSSNYPLDIAYNITVSENCVIHNFKYTDSELKGMLSNKTFINVTQGYTSCTLCTVSPNSFITADNGIYKSLTNAGYDVLKISDGCIELKGFDRGFIGGASFMLSAKILAFNGKIENHPDFSNMKLFCKKYGVEILSLSEKQLSDIGSIVPIYG